jgi:hypothetical protein
MDVANCVIPLVPLVKMPIPAVLAHQRCSLVLQNVPQPVTADTTLIHLQEDANFATRHARLAQLEIKTDVNHVSKDSISKTTIVCRIALMEPSPQTESALHVTLTVPPVTPAPPTVHHVLTPSLPRRLMFVPAYAQSDNTETSPP